VGTDVATRGAMSRRPLGFALLLSLVGCTPAWGGAADGFDPWGDEDADPLEDGGRPSKDGGRRTDTGAIDPSDDAPAPPPDPTPDPDLPLVKGLDIQEVAIFQGVKISIAKGGTKVGKRNAPVIVGREGLLRVYVAPAAGWEAREVIGKLVLSSGSSPAKTIKSAPLNVTSASSDGALGSTINFEIPSDAIKADSSYVVSLHTAAGQPGSASSANARFPASGSADPLAAKDTGSTFKITIVPVKYGADGSNRLPDVSDAQKEEYRRAAYTMYPARKVEITFRTPYAWSSSIHSSGSGFDELLDAMVKLRQSDGAPKDVYYYGAFAAASSFGSYCGGGCVTGLCGLSDDPSDSIVRACVGVGFTGAYTAQTMAHEVGHASGRYHAPCGGAAGADPAYPYSGAKIGAWGYDIVGKKLIDPKSTVDFMSYCDPVFVSDFNYNALAERMGFVSGGKSMYAPGAPKKFRLVRVRADGSLASSTDSMDVDEPLFADPRAITFEDSSGKTLATTTGHFYPYDHLPGGFLLVPEAPKGSTAMTVKGLVSSGSSRLSL